MRKVLSFVLVLSLVLGSFSMAFAATPVATGLSDIDGIANEEAIQVSYDLGIVTGNPDGTFLPTKSVNRAEFAAMITRALGVPDSALAGYTSTSFKDTAGYGWAVPYLAFCQSKGIMLGDGAGNVMPGRTINTNEAITMALRAIGYTSNSSELVGTWPSNYVTKAQDLGVYSDVAAVVNVDKANAAQVIYNLLDEQKVAVNTDGDTNPLWINGVVANGAVTLLNAGLDCVGTDEIVAIDGVDSLITLTPYVGAWATVYRDDAGDGDVVAVKPLSTFLTGNFNSATEFEANDVKYVVKAAGVSDYAQITNAAIEANTVGAITAPMFAAAAPEFTLAVDVSGKTISKIYSAATWIVTDRDQADAGVQDDITDDQELLGNSFDLDVDKNIDLTRFQLVGVKDLASIAKDDVVYVYTLGNGNAADIVKVAVGTENPTGKFTDLDGTEFTVGAKTYELASDAGIVFSAAVQPGSLPVAGDLGDDFDLTLDAYGNVYDWEATSTNTDNYGVIVAVDNSSFDDARVKLYLPTDEKKVFSVDEDVTIPTTFTCQAIAYNLDKDGIIDATTQAITFNTSATATMSGIKTISVHRAATTSYAIAADCKVFTIDSTTGAVTYDISSLAKIDLRVNLAVDGGFFSYILNDDDEVVAMVVDSAAAGRSADDVYAVINTLTDVYDATQDDNVQKVVGFADGVALDKNTDGSAMAALAAGGGLFKITYDGDGYISDGVLPGGANVASVGALAAVASFAAINGANDAVQVTGGGLAADTWFDLAKDVVVYEKVMDGADFDKYVISSATKIKDGANLKIYDVDTDEDDGYDVVIWCEK